MQLIFNWNALIAFSLFGLLAGFSDIFMKIIKGAFGFGSYKVLSLME